MTTTGVFSTHAHRLLGALRVRGGSARLAELSGSPHDLGPILEELCSAGVLELVDGAGAGAVQRPEVVRLMLRAARTRRGAQELTARLVPVSVPR